MTNLIVNDLNLKYVASSEDFSTLPIIAVDAYEYLTNSQKTEGVTRFIFERHGESTSNVEKSIAGRTLDVDLSDKGVMQACETGKLLETTTILIDIVYSSPSRRALRTAKFLPYNQLIEQDERLYEKFYGPYEGASEKDYQPVKHAEEVDNSGPNKSFIDKFEFKAHPEMESMSDVYTRVSDFLKDAHNKHRGQNVAVVTHNGVMKALFMAASAEQGFDVDYRSFELGNASILIVEVEDNHIRVQASNGLKPKLLPMNGSYSNSFPLEACKNKKPY